MTGEPSKRPWWVRGRAARDPSLRILLAPGLTLVGGLAVTVAVRDGSWLLGIPGSLSLVLAAWMWAIVLYQRRHQDRSDE